MMARNATLQGPDPVDIKVGEALRVARKKARLTREGLGQALGISPQQVQKYENGVTRLSASMMVHAAAAMGCSAMEFLSGVTPALSGPPHEFGQLWARLAEADRDTILALARRLAAEPAPRA
jgi:transcriptional regulator with XRE-family HTH domain